MYKERILGLEEQVSLLREQLSKEARSRRSYILSSQTINADVSELRQQLGDSLDMVHNASRAHLQSGLLDREASRLEAAIARQPPEITSRLTPSKRSPGSPVVPRARSSGPIRWQFLALWFISHMSNCKNYTLIGISFSNIMEEKRS